MATDPGEVTAPCGCRFYGRNLRFCDNERCDAIGTGSNPTGTFVGRHVQAARKRAVRMQATPTTTP